MSFCAMGSGETNTVLKLCDAGTGMGVRHVHGVPEAAWGHKVSWMEFAIAIVCLSAFNRDSDMDEMIIAV